MQNVLLSISKLGKNFGGVTALMALDLDVERNRILGLIGPNGSGKTTFFNVVTGIYPLRPGGWPLREETLPTFLPRKFTGQA